MNFRWLGRFRAKAPPKSTDAYRTAALVVPDDVTVFVPADDDVEAPPVMVRVGESTLGPDYVPLSPMRKRIVLGIGLFTAILQLVVIFEPR